jgi:hypothetical protein
MRLTLSYRGVLDPATHAPPVALKYNTKFWSEQNERVPVVPGPEGEATLV